MIWVYFLAFIGYILNGIFSWLPRVDTLPPILGVDIDTSLVQGVGSLYAFAHAVWPIAVVLEGFTVLLGYYSVKIVMRIFLGHRAP